MHLKKWVFLGGFPSGAAAAHRRVVCLDFFGMFRLFGECLDLFGNVQTFLGMFRLVWECLDFFWECFDFLCYDFLQNV